MEMKLVMKSSFLIFIIFAAHIAHGGELLSEDIGDAKKNKGSTAIKKEHTPSREVVVTFGTKLMASDSLIQKSAVILKP